MLEQLNIALNEEGIYMIVFDGVGKMMKYKCSDVEVPQKIKECVENYHSFRKIENESLVINEQAKLKKVNSEYIQSMFQKNTLDHKLILFYSQRQKSFHLQAFREFSKENKREGVEFLYINMDKNEVPRLSYLPAVYFFHKNKQRPIKMRKKITKKSLLTFLSSCIQSEALSSEL